MKKSICILFKMRILLAFSSLWLGNECKAQPVITSFSPGFATAGSTVLITGSGFDNNPANNIVCFGAVKAAVTFASTTSLMVTVPFGATYQPIRITNILTNLTAFSSRSFVPTFIGGNSFTTSSFASKFDFGVGSSPNGISIGDLDEDGKPDIVIANIYTNSISILKNTSTPGIISGSSFAAPVNITVGVQPYGVAVGDIDNDGKPDIAVSNSGDNTISVLRNIASPGIINSGSFEPKVDYSCGSTPKDLVISDLNNDGRADLVVANSNSSDISVLRNLISAPGTLNSSSFDTKVNYAVGTGPKALAVGDFDNDGKMDIVTVSNNNAYAYYLHNSTGPGAFSPGSFSGFNYLFLTTNSCAVRIGDMDGDGKPEVVSLGNNCVSIFQNNSSPGSLSFSPAVNLPLGALALGLDIADLNGDGITDIAATEFGNDKVALFKNNCTAGTISSGFFDVHQDYTTGLSPQFMSVGDLDADGKPDLVVANVNDYTISILRNISASGALPVKLLNFYGSIKNNMATMTWEVAQQENIDKYIVQQSEDGIHFTSCGSVTALGNGAGHVYEFSTSLMVNKGNYFRLKIIDINGSYTLSKIIHLFFSNEKLSCFPVPAKGVLSLIHPQATISARIQIVDLMGRILKEVSVIPGSVQTKIDIEQLSAGKYYIVYKAKDQLLITSVVIQ